jgi:hypothetical protein
LCSCKAWPTLYGFLAPRATISLETCYRYWSQSKPQKKKKKKKKRKKVSRFRSETKNAQLKIQMTRARQALGWNAEVRVYELSVKQPGAPRKFYHNHAET